MKIKVEKILEAGVVEISSNMGKVIAVCYRDDLEPGKYYDVEFDLTDSIQLGINAQKVNDKSFFIQRDDNFNYMQGESEGIDEYGTLWFRLSDDCLIMMDSDDSNIREGDQLLIQIEIGKLEMTIIGV